MSSEPPSPAEPPSSAELTTSAQPPGSVERRIVTVLFADLVGFTPLSERLDPEDVATIQDAYFAGVRATIERYHGVLEKFIGDAAMAVFGAPIARDDDAERAVRAGLALIGSVEQLGAQLGLDSGELRLRVGVNSGEVIHATSGPDVGRVTGDTVNTAARLQANARPGSVLIGELTALSVAATIAAVPVGAVELKGKAAPVRAWEAVAARATPSREDALGALQAPMLGRDVELGRLLDALGAVTVARQASRLVVIAPPGVGKTRLLQELATRAERQAIVLRGRVRPEGTAPYETVAQLLGAFPKDDLSAALARQGTTAGRRSVVEREVGRLLEGAASIDLAHGDLAAEREGRFDAWLTALDALGDGPQLWLIEDVHWAGRDLLAFLDAAGRSASPHGRLVVTTARPSLLESSAAWCDADRLELEPLSRSAAAALVDALIGPVLPRDLVDAIVERSDGTPLFIEELLRTWASVGTLVHEDGWSLAVPPGAISLPPTVQAIYAAQLDDLPPDARLIARRGAVAGRRVPVDALDVLEVRDRAGLGRLRRRGLLVGPVHDPVTGDTYAYRHALLRDAGYASLARADRARLHLAMARWLAGVAGERGDVVAEAVAEHLALALESRPALATDGLPARASLAADAAAWSERAAEAALRLAAPDAARRLMARAVGLTDAKAGGADLARRRRRLGEVLAASADLDAGIVELEGALALSDDDAGVAASAYALGRAYMQQIRFEEADALAARTLDRLARTPPVLRARLHALHAWAVAAQGRTDGVLDEADLARDLARGSGDPLLELDVLEHVAATRDEVDETTEEIWTELETRAREAGAWHQVVAAARARAQFRSVVDPRRAAGALAETAELARAHGLREQAGWAEYARVELLWVLGEWDAALALGTAVTELAERSAYERLAFRTYVVLLPIAAARRDPPVVERYVRWWAGAKAHFPVSASPYGRMLVSAIDIWAAEATGAPRPVPSSDLVDAAVPMVNPHFLAATETVARRWLDVGHTEPAAAVAKRVGGYAADDPTPLLGASAGLLAAWIDPATADAAVDLARAAEAPWWIARALRAAGATEAAFRVESRLGIAVSSAPAGAQGADDARAIVHGDAST